MAATKKRAPRTLEEALQALAAGLNPKKLHPFLETRTGPNCALCELKPHEGVHKGMSYDVDICIDVCPHCQHGETVLDLNYTSNMGRAWREAGFDIMSFHEAEAATLIKPLSAAIHALENDPYYKTLEPDNGWGSVDGSLRNFLKPILLACEKHPQGVFYVSG